MRSRLFYAFTILVAAMGVLSATTAQAQLVAVGPYYATPSWDQKLACDLATTCTRFVVLSNWNNEAVLDRETGLVWQKSPNPTRVTWAVAQFACLQNIAGGRLGWKLPSVQELLTLVDGAQLPFPFPPVPGTPVPLPAGHPFTNIQSFFYWSSTTNESTAFPGTPTAWVFGFDEGRVSSAGKSGTGNVWCVRGGPGKDSQ
jgi:hypothetical protein